MYQQRNWIVKIMTIKKLTMEGQRMKIECHKAIKFGKNLNMARHFFLFIYFMQMINLFLKMIFIHKT